MNPKQLSHHWQYFLFLEKDLINLKNYIEISEDNFESYSFELSKILQLACAEIDSVCRTVCNLIDDENDYFDETKYSGNIQQYKAVILKVFPKLQQVPIIVPELENDIIPWKNWNAETPMWWKDYNLVKHYRHTNFRKANLENTIYALSGLMVLNLYMIRISGSDKFALQNFHSKYFDAKYFSPYIVADPKELPDFE